MTAKYELLAHQLPMCQYYKNCCPNGVAGLSKSIIGTATNMKCVKFLTLWLLVWFSLKTSSLDVFCMGISLVPKVLELFKPSKDFGSLQVCNETKFLGFGFFVSDNIIGLFGPLHLALGPKHYFTQVFIGN